MTSSLRGSQPRHRSATALKLNSLLRKSAPAGRVMQSSGRLLSVLLLRLLSLALLAPCCASPSPAAANATKESCKANAGRVPGPPAYRECNLQYYVHVLVGDVSLNNHLFPPLNTSYSGPFGTGELFAFNATKGPERVSELVGHVRGYTINSAYTASGTDLIEVELLSYDDGVYKGTVQIQGEIVVPADGGPNEVAIVGGTGSFRGARGFGLIARLLVDGNYRRFHHDLHFL